MADLNFNTSIATSNVNGVNIPIKRQRLAEETKIMIQLYAAYRLKTKEWKKIYHANINLKKQELVILTIDEIDFRANKLLGRKRNNT